MQLSESQNWTTRILLIAIVAIVLGVIYYSYSDSSSRVSVQERKEFDYGGRPTQPVNMPNQIILTRDQKFIIGRNCLVYKGVEKKTLFMDLYLLDMDSEQSYEKRYLLKDAKKKMELGDGEYRFVSANSRKLVLENLANQQ